MSEMHFGFVSLSVLTSLSYALVCCLQLKPGKVIMSLEEKSNKFNGYCYETL